LAFIAKGTTQDIVGIFLQCLILSSGQKPRLALVSAHARFEITSSIIPYSFAWSAVMM
jgi:hypothetical protein